MPLGHRNLLDGRARLGRARFGTCGRLPPSAKRRGDRRSGHLLRLLVLRGLVLVLRHLNRNRHGHERHRDVRGRHRWRRRGRGGGGCRRRCRRGCCGGRCCRRRCGCRCGGRGRRRRSDVVRRGSGTVVVGVGDGGGASGALVTVTVSTGGGVDGGGAALLGPGADVAVCGGSVALVLSLALVSATATPPTATTATTAAIPNTNCGSRCQVVRGSSIGSVGGTYCTCGRASVAPVLYTSPVYGTTSSPVLSSWDHASARNVADPGASNGSETSTGSTGATPVFTLASAP